MPVLAHRQVLGVITKGMQSRSRGQMLRDVLLVAKGTILGQAPFVVASPFITRLYLPAELGIFGLAMAFVGIVAPMAGLRLELAAISARGGEDARNLFVLSAISIIPVTLLSTGLLAALKLASIGSYQTLPWLLVTLTGWTIAAAGAYSTLRSLLVRRHHFQLVANSLALQGTIRAGTPIAAGPFHYGAAALIGGELLARCISVLQLARRAQLARSVAGIRLTYASLAATLRKYWKYPVLLTPSALVDATAVALPVPIIATCYDLGVAGKFALVQRLVVLPAALIGSSVGDVFHAHAAEVVHGGPGAVRGLVVSTAKRLLLLGLLVYAPLAALAPIAAPWAFGSNWTGTGALIAALAPACVAQAVVSPLSRGLLLNNKEERKLLADLICLVLPASTLYLASSLSISTAVACLSAASVVASGCYFFIIVTAFERR